MHQAPVTQHTAFTQLPIVDITRLFSDRLEERQQAAADLDRAARDAGFLYLKGHQISKEIIENLKNAVKDYFAQATDTKMVNYIGHSQNHSGYVPQGEEEFYSATVDLKEAYDIGFESAALMARFAPENTGNQWPVNPDFKPAVQAYYNAMLDLSRTLFKGFALALGQPEDTFVKHLNKPPSQLRMIHYFDNPNATEDDSGIGAHTDYEFFTILLPTSPGLQVLNGANQWINVPLIEDCFVINIGDMMEAVSNGIYVATSHRVRKVQQERYSFPFFCSLDYETVVEAIPALLHPEQTIASEPIICGDHLLAQTMQTFKYLIERNARGEISLPEKAKGLASFGSAALKEG